MTTTKEFKNIIKKFREPLDYSISYVEGGKEVYSIHSTELKRLLFSENLRKDISPMEAECKVEISGENIKKTVSIVGNQNRSLESNKIALNNDLIPKWGGFVVPKSSLSIQKHDNQPLIHSVGLGENLSQLTQQVPMYDNQGNQIVGRENIIREVERRRAERAEEEKSGRVQDNSVRQENYQDNGDTFYYEYFEVSK